MVSQNKIPKFGMLLLLALPAAGILLSGCPGKSAPAAPNNATNTPTPVFTPTTTVSSTPTGTPTRTATSTPSGTPTSTATATASPTITSTPTVTPTTCTGVLGNKANDSTYDWNGDGYVLFFRYQATSNTTLTSLTANMEYVISGPDPSIQYGVYSDASGPKPGSLLASTSVFNTDPGGNPYGGDLTLPLTSPLAITSGTWYWIAYDGGSNAIFDDGTSSSNYFILLAGATFTALPSDLSGYSPSDYGPSAYQANYDFWGTTCP